MPDKMKAPWTVFDSEECYAFSPVLNRNGYAAIFKTTVPVSNAVRAMIPSKAKCGDKRESALDGIRNRVPGSTGLDDRPLHYQGVRKHIADEPR